MLLVKPNIYFNRIHWKTLSSDYRLAIGRKSVSLLSIGVKFALSHYDGTMMELRQRVKMLFIGAKISRQAALISPGLNPSGLADVNPLDGLSNIVICNELVNWLLADAVNN